MSNSKDSLRDSLKEQIEQAVTEVEESRKVRTPGRVINGQKVTWTFRDMEQFKKVTFIPEETVPVTFNGLTYNLIADYEVTVPEPIFNIYREYRRKSRRTGIPRPGIKFEPGAGTLTS